MTPRIMKVAAVAVLTAFAFTPSSRAASWGQLDKITFSRAVALPGVVLPAGAYVFEIANPNTSANVVRVIHRDTQRVYFAGFTERVQRPAGAPAGQRITMGEPLTGGAFPIEVWYPAAQAEGRRFLYR